jgi:hypothetical protein
MGKKKITMQTNNKEIYQKLNLLNIVPEVIIENTSLVNLNKIIKIINKKSDSIETKVLSDSMILVKKKRNDTNYNIYLR